KVIAQGQIRFRFAFVAGYVPRPQLAELPAIFGFTRTLDDLRIVSSQANRRAGCSTPLVAIVLTGPNPLVNCFQLELTLLHRTRRPLDMLAGDSDVTASFVILVIALFTTAWGQFREKEYPDPFAAWGCLRVAVQLCNDVPGRLLDDAGFSIAAMVQ